MTTLIPVDIDCSRRSALLAAAAATLLAVAPVAAQTYPLKPVRIIVPYGAAGPTDVIARVIAARMEASFGQPVVVENKPGAATMIGAESVSKAPKDGYTLLLGTTSTFSTNPHLYQRIAYTIDDFAPVALLAKTD